MARGVFYIVTEGRVVTGFPDEFTAPGQAEFGGVSLLVIVALLVVVAADIILRKSAFMRQLYYIGSNERAARVSGINVELARIGVYLTTALLAGLAGSRLRAQFARLSPSMGMGKRFLSIAAAVIGGVIFHSGEGTCGGRAGRLFPCPLSSRFYCSL